MANFCLKFHAKQMRAKYGDDIFEIINRQFYVDDMITSFPTVEAARSARQRLTACLSEGGFELTKFSSCYPEVLIDAPSSPSQATVGTPNSAQTEPKEDEPFELRMSDIPDIRSDLAECIDTFGAEDFREDTKDFLRPNETGLSAASKILGLGYNELTDNFYLRISDRCSMEVKTKRQMLKLQASMYDPMGYYSSVILPAKIIFQIVNERGFGWDEILPEDILAPWRTWQNSIPEIANITIPRYSSAPAFVNSMRDLCIFSDSSLEAYGVSAYVRRWQPDGDTALVRIIRAKSRVVPLAMSKIKLKNQVPHDDSVPQLELNACKLAVELRTLIDCEAIKKYDRTFFFTDSNTCLIWMGDFDKKFRSFCNFRVKKIRNNSDVFREWRWCPTAENPADILSHGCLASEEQKWDLIKHGPPFLSLPDSAWPPRRPITKEKPTQEEIAALSIAAEFAPSILATDLEIGDASNEPVPDWVHALIQKVGEWPRKVKKIARAKKGFWGLILFRRNKGYKVDIDYDNHSTEEYNKAEIDVLRAIQLKHFANEMETLVKMGVTCPNARCQLRDKNALSSLNPFIDEDMTLRAGGRLANSTDIPFDTKFPLILPKNDADVDSLIRHIHQSNGHLQVNHCYHLLKKRFHIQGGRTTICRVLAKCSACQRLEKRPHQQMMGDLPLGRTSLQYAFRHCAVDAFGPYSVKWSTRAFHKRWVILFTCLGTRAISLVPVREMSTSSMINALVVFSSRHPGVEHIYSDCGSNFKGADNLLSKETATFNVNELNKEFLHKNVQWHFGPPNAPHYGGVHERCVQSVKRILKFILEKEKLDLEVFETCLAKAEYLVNTRPLTKAQKGQVGDFQTLCPNDFLFPHLVTRSVLNLLPPTPSGGDSLRETWKKSRAIYDEFSRRWQTEYLSELQKRPKGWRQFKNNLTEGQIVLLVDEECPRDKWRIARITEILSQGTVTHRVKVMTPDRKEFVRHTNKLVLLEFDQENENELAK